LEEEIMEYHLLTAMNIIPARNSTKSSYLSWFENWVFAWFYYIGYFEYWRCRSF